MSSPLPSLETDIAATAAKVETVSSSDSRLRADVAWLADDARMGREAGTQGHRDAANFVAKRMEQIGLQPGTPEGWFQNVPLVYGVPKPEAAAMSIISAGGEKVELKSAQDFIVYPSIVSDDFAVDKVSAVFVGYGVSAPSLGYDDYAGVDVNGKVVVYFSGAPEALDDDIYAHFDSAGLKAKDASAHGAIGVIMLTTRDVEGRLAWEQRKTSPIISWRWPDGRVHDAAPNVRASATMHPGKAPLLFDGAAHSYADVRKAASGSGDVTGSFDLTVKISMAGAMERTTISSPNVVGLFPGADPILKDEYVVLSAHLDHVGFDEAALRGGRDGVFNGALDNAAGIATMLEAAQKFAIDGATARSVLFVALTAEEKGLLGSDYFVHFPPVGEGEMVANINIDMPVMLSTLADVVAFGADRSTIGSIIRGALEETGIALSPDPIPELGFFTRSDHYRFVEQGVPSTFLWAGFASGGETKFRDFYENHYHAPSDDISLPIRFKDLARFAEVNYIIARALAVSPERPVWNEGDFFGDLFAKH